MMMGTVPTSVPQFILLGNWLVEGRFAKKWSLLKHNRPFWLLSALFLMHVAGLLWTNDLASGWNDVRTKIPLMFLPLILFSTAPLQVRELQLVIAAFVAGSVVDTAW